MRRTKLGAIVASCSLILAASPARADNDPPDRDAEQQQDSRELRDMAEKRGPMEDLDQASDVVAKMRMDARTAELLDRAQGIFIIPDYVAAALIGGVSGGEGMLFAQTDGEWGHPAFYDVGTLSLGAQAGFAAGSIVMVILSRKGLENFEKQSTFSLSADAGLVIADWSGYSLGEGLNSDIIVWSDVEGLLGKASLGVGGVSWDDDENTAFYGERVSPERILSGGVDNAYAEQIRIRLEGASSPQD